MPLGLVGTRGLVFVLLVWLCLVVVALRLGVESRSLLLLVSLVPLVWFVVVFVSRRLADCRWHVRERRCRGCLVLLLRVG